MCRADDLCLALSKHSVNLAVVVIDQNVSSGFLWVSG